MLVRSYDSLKTLTIKMKITDTMFSYEKKNVKKKKLMHKVNDKVIYRMSEKKTKL